MDLWGEGGGGRGIPSDIFTIMSIFPTTLDLDLYQSMQLVGRIMMWSNVCKFVALSFPPRPRRNIKILYISYG